MFKYIIASLVLLIFTSCISNNGKIKSDIDVKWIVKSDDSIFTPGILRLRTDVLEQQNDTILLIDKNEEIRDFICSTNEHEPAFVNAKDVTIRSYYPDNYVLILDAFELNNQYKVYFNRDWFIIPKLEGVTIYEDWEIHLKNTYILTDSKNPLRVEPNENSYEMSYDYSLLNFVCKKIEGDWIYVTCNIDCEGCPIDNENLKGWLKWKEGNKLLIKLYYSC